MAKSKLDIPPEMLLGVGKQDNPILTLMALRVMETAQRRSESVQVGPRTETGVPFSQMWAGVVSWMVGTGGLMVLGYVVLRLLGVIPSWLGAAGIVVWAFVMGALVYLVVVPGLRAMSLPKQVMGIMAIATLITLGLGWTIKAQLSQDLDGAGEFLLVAALLLGSGCTVFGYMNVYRMASELINPLYPESPQLKVMKPYLSNVFQPGGGPQVQVHSVRPFPMAQNGRVKGYGRTLPELQPPQGPGGQVQHFWTPDAETMNDIWFALYAAGCNGLSRSNILQNPQVDGSPALPGLEPLADGSERLEPEYLGRSQYDRLIQRGEAYGWWVRRGQRLAPELLKEWVEIRAECEAMWQEMTGGALPLPDYWNVSYEVQPVIEMGEGALL